MHLTNSEPGAKIMAGSDLQERGEFVLIIHEVQDYAHWKSVFDEASSLRRDAGEIEYQLLAFDIDPQRIVHFSRWTSLRAAKAFFHSPELEQIRRDAGVIAPEFIYLSEIERARL
jgi:heme-degrading monooxygenase HmoA